MKSENKKNNLPLENFAVQFLSLSFSQLVPLSTLEILLLSPQDQPLKFPTSPNLVTAPSP